MQVEYVLCIIHSSNFSVKYLSSGATAQEELCQARVREEGRQIKCILVPVLTLDTMACVCVCVCARSNICA